MHLLNSKCIFNCNEKEEKEHNQVIKDILIKLENYPNYDCVAIIKYFDIANKDREVKIKPCNLHSCYKVVQNFDCKNGIDIAIVEDFLTFIVYGQGYSMNNKYHVVQVGIQIRPYDESKDYICQLETRYAKNR